MEDKKTLELDYTKDETEQQVLENESSILDGMLAAAEYALQETMTFNIKRGGKCFFSFKVHPISEEMMFDIRKKYTKYTKNRRAGVRVAEELDVAKFRCSVIYNSTVGNNGEKIWDNRALWEGLRKQGHVVVNALDVIEAVLLPGEKDWIMEALDELGGYGSDDDDGLNTESRQVETAKN